jgi:iron complex transport system substrate-binding protein
MVRKNLHTIKMMWWVLCLVGLLSACVVPVAPPAESTVSSTAAATTETASEEATTEPAEASSSTVASAAAGCEADFRLFDHDLLATDPICIPNNPQRMAFIDGTIADAIALDVDTVTRHYYFDALLGDFPTLVDEATISQMTDIGNTWELNPESLVLARPDLIVTSTWWAEPNAQIQSIAPTVIFDHDRAASWVDSFDAVAQLLGRTAEKEALLAGIDERIAKLSEVLGEAAADTTFSVAIIEGPTQLWLFTTKNFGAELAIKAGLSPAPGVMTPEEAIAATGDAYAVSVVLEQLSMIDADHIFLFTNWGDNAQFDLLSASPVWQSFVASNPDRIHFLNGEYWVRDHPISAHRVLDDLFRYIAGVDPAEVAPNPFAY